MINPNDQQERHRDGRAAAAVAGVILGLLFAAFWTLVTILVWLHWPDLGVLIGFVGVLLAVLLIICATTDDRVVR